jgi:hypothetical protein
MGQSKSSLQHNIFYINENRTVNIQVIKNTPYIFTTTMNIEKIENFVNAIDTTFIECNGITIKPLNISFYAIGHNVKILEYKTNELEWSSSKTDFDKLPKNTDTVMKIDYNNALSIIYETIGKNKQMIEVVFYTTIKC